VEEELVERPIDSGEGAADDSTEEPIENDLPQSNQ